MNNEKGIIIAGFPGCGKTTIANTRDDLSVSDSDSSLFHWVVNEETKEKTLNPEWPENYISHITERKMLDDFIFVSTHREILELLIERGIDFILVYPEKELKDEYIQRYTNRGNNESFVNLLNTKWDSFMNDMDEISRKINFSFVLGKGQYLIDVIKPISLLPKEKINEMHLKIYP